MQVGYGTLKRSDIATSVVSIDVESMLKKNPTTVARMIQGAAAAAAKAAADAAEAARLAAEAATKKISEIPAENRTAVCVTK